MGSVGGLTYTLGREGSIGERGEHWGERGALGRKGSIGEKGEHWGERGALGRKGSIGERGEHWVERGALGRERRIESWSGGGMVWVVSVVSHTNWNLTN